MGTDLYVLMYSGGVVLAQEVAYYQRYEVSSLSLQFLASLHC